MNKATGSENKMQIRYESIRMQFPSLDKDSCKEIIYFQWMSNNSRFITELKNNTENVNYDQTTSISIVKFKESLVFFSLEIEL